MCLVTFGMYRVVSSFQEQAWIYDLLVLIRFCLVEPITLHIYMYIIILVLNSYFTANYATFKITITPLYFAFTRVRSVSPNYSPLETAVECSFSYSQRLRSLNCSLHEPLNSKHSSRIEQYPDRVLAMFISVCRLQQSKYISSADVFFTECNCS